MEDGSFEEAVVVRYLLGDLPEEARIGVEGRAFSDPEYLRIIEAVEADLIDSYVRGEMPAAERQQFENRFLASPERRKKVEFARSLARVTRESRPARSDVAPSSVARYSWREALVQLLRGQNPAFQFAMAAAAVILLAVVFWQVTQTDRLRESVGQLEAEQRFQQQREQALQQAVNQERARAEGLAGEMQRILKGTGRPTLPVASLMLLPGTPRSGNAAPELVIPSPVQLARIQIQLEARDDYPHFRVELRTRSGDEILTRNGLRVQRLSAGRAVVVEIPASALGAGNYDLTLQGVTGGQTKDIGYYSFSVQKKEP